MAFPASRQMISIGVTTDLSEKEQSQISVTALNKNITIVGAVGSVTIHNLLGHVVAQSNLKGTAVLTVDETGVYLVSVDVDGERTTHKVVCE